MLWLLSFLPFPEKSKSWQIADIHPLLGAGLTKELERRWGDGYKKQRIRG